MNTERAPLFGEDDLDLSDFSPAANSTTRSKVQKEVIRQVATERGFSSREPTPPAPTPEPARQRRYTTGRNRQLNLKVTDDALRRFYAVADKQGWVLGEAFEFAVGALEAKLKP